MPAVRFSARIPQVGERRIVDERLPVVVNKEAHGDVLHRLCQTELDLDRALDGLSKLRSLKEYGARNCFLGRNGRLLGADQFASAVVKSNFDRVIALFEHLDVKVERRLAHRLGVRQGSRTDALSVQSKLDELRLGSSVSNRKRRAVQCLIDDDLSIFAQRCCPRNR